MNYAFSPLPDHRMDWFYKNYRDMWPHRSQTTLIDQPGITRIRDFLDILETELKTNPNISRVGSFLIATHANETGWMQMELDEAFLESNANGLPIHETSYEVLENAVNSGDKNTILIPETLIKPRPEGSPSNAIFYIRGCKLGQAKKFLEKFKQALGSKVDVSAPKVYIRNQPLTDVGVFEYLGYDYKITRRRALSRDELIDAFQKGERADGTNSLPAKPFCFIDGTVVPKEKWKKWIPKKIGIGVRGGHPFVKFGREIGGLTKIRLKVEFRHNWPPKLARYTFTIPDLSSNPGKYASRLQTLSESIKLHPRFQPGHPFPEFERYGFLSTQDFVDGFCWAFNWNASKNQLVCNGRRHVYTVNLPVTDPATGNLLLNYYPFDDKPETIVETLSNLAVTNLKQFQELFELV